jgi:hypothetical protein
VSFEPRAREDQETIEEAERVLRCARCAHAIARERDRMSVHGAHAHDFMNPAAVRYRVECFRDASGCRTMGEPSTVWSWFPGWAWRIALCAACSAHLGWDFTQDTQLFWALLPDRLTASR